MPVGAVWRAAPNRCLPVPFRHRAGNCFAAAFAIALGGLARVLEAKLTQNPARCWIVGEVVGNELFVVNVLGVVNHGATCFSHKT
jgi:hypothetical protein